MKKELVFILFLCVFLITSLSGDVLLDEPPLEKGKILLSAYAQGYAHVFRPSCDRKDNIAGEMS